jgi:hypothetical protein
MARVNQLSADATSDGANITIGIFYINAISAAILFDSGATHSFIFARHANTNELPLQNMQKPLVVITPKGPIEANYMTNILTFTIIVTEPSKSLGPPTVVLVHRTSDNPAGAPDHLTSSVSVFFTLPKSVSPVTQILQHIGGMNMRNQLQQLYFILRYRHYKINPPIATYT